MTPAQHYAAAEAQLDQARAHLEQMTETASVMAQIAAGADPTAVALLAQERMSEMSYAQTLIASASVHATLAAVDGNVAMQATRSSRRHP